MKAIYARRGICLCGFPVLADEIALGTEYEIRPSISGGAMNLKCGGCGKVMTHVPCVYVERRGKSAAGFLPAAIFEIDEGSGQNVDSRK